MTDKMKTIYEMLEDQIKMSEKAADAFEELLCMQKELGIKPLPESLKALKAHRESVHKWQSKLQELRNSA
jgi:hypothetical protein